MEAQHDHTQTDPTSFDPVDLCDLDDDYGEAEVEQREFDPVPDGKYQVNIERVELTRTQTSKTPMLKWTFRVLGPRCRGRLLWKNSTVGDKAHELAYGGISPQGYLVASEDILYVPSGRAMPAAFDRKD